MVRRALAWTALFLAAALLAVLLAAGHWLLRTEEGARFLLQAVSRWTPVSLAGEAVQGRIWGGLIIEGLEVRWPGGRAGAGEFRLEWTPAALLDGLLSLQRLHIANGEIRWEAGREEGPPAPGEAPLSLKRPRVPDSLLSLRGRVDQLQLRNMAFGPADGESFELHSLSAELRWEEGALTIEGLQLESQAGGLIGLLAVDLLKTGLRADLHARLTAAPERWQRWRLQADLQPEGDGLAGGPLTLAVGTGSSGAVLEGGLRIHPQRLLLEQINLRRPGGKVRVRGDAQLAWAERPVQARAALTLDGLDLAPETGVATALSGTIRATWNPQSWQGRFSLRNAVDGWQSARLAAAATGDLQQAEFRDISAEWLRGVIDGTLTLSWQEGFSLSADLHGRDLDPSGFPGAPAGRVTLSLAGQLAVPADKGLQVRVEGRFLESSLQGRPFAGPFAGGWRQAGLFIETLDLHGAGYHLQAAGRLDEKLTFDLQADELPVLLPQLDAGRAEARGWVRWSGEGGPAGRLTATGSNLDYRQLQVDDWRVDLDYAERRQPGHLQARIEGLNREQIALALLRIDADGSLQDHRIEVEADWGTGGILSRAAGAWSEGLWRGEVRDLQGREVDLGSWRAVHPFTLSAGARSLELGDFLLRAEGGGELQLDAELNFSPARGRAELAWRQLSLGHANPWLPAGELSGETSGDLQLQIHSEERLDLFGDLSLAGTLALDHRNLRIERSTVDFAWAEKGLEVQGELGLAGGGRAAWTVNSRVAGRPGIPERGEFSARWQELELSRLRTFYPMFTGELEGEALGSMEGSWGPRFTLDVAGRTRVEGGHLVLRDDEGEIDFALRQAELRWRWAEDSLRSELDLALAEYGEAGGELVLPLPARVPTSIRETGAVRGGLNLQAREQGLLEAFLPGLVEDSRGLFNADLEVAGTWAEPRFSGRFSLREAGAMLPGYGVRLEEIALQGHLQEDEVRLSSLLVRSGKGRLEGSGALELKDWRPGPFKGTLSGKDFQVYNVPELQIALSPDLKFEGRADRLAVSGEVLIPEFVVYGAEPSQVVRPSEDVVLVNRDEPQQSGDQLPFDLDLDLQVVLGERVLIKLRGLDARLEGGLHLASTAQEEVIAQGEIRVIEGHYAAYGIKLPITRGRLFFPGGPVSKPTLDIRAMRTVGEVQTGVRVTGTPQNPMVELISDPAMPDTDVLSYIVLGRPLGSGQGNTDVLMLAAGALLSQGESAALRDKLQRRLGIDVIEVETGAGDVQESMVTIGKYLTPDIYVSFGQGLFTDKNVARMRYSLGEHWQVESQLGEESGADLYYKIEFR